MFRAHQFVYYNATKVQFGLRTIAFAPMKKLNVEQGKPEKWEPFFWVKATDLNKQRNLNDKDIIWAQRMWQSKACSKLVLG